MRAADYFRLAAEYVALERAGAPARRGIAWKWRAIYATAQAVAASQREGAK